MFRIKNPVRARGADELIAEIAAHTANRDDLHVLGEGIVDLPIARLDLGAQSRLINKIIARPAHSSGARGSTGRAQR